MQKEYPHIYLVPGLGADGRLFNRLSWRSGVQATSLKWIEPFPNEKISDYALRMCEQVDTSKPFVFVGVSLGGIMSIEMAKHIHPEKIVIISSIKHRDEKPFYFSLGRFFKNGIWFPVKQRQLLYLLVRLFFGKVSKDQFEIFRDMLLKTSRNFIRWADVAVVKWDNTQVFENLTHINGSKDLIFPERFLKNHISIKGGTHFMVVNRAAEIMKIIEKFLF